MIGYSNWETIAAWTIFVPVLGIGILWPLVMVWFGVRWLIAAVRDGLDP